MTLFASSSCRLAPARPVLALLLVSMFALVLSVIAPPARADLAPLSSDGGCYVEGDAVPVRGSELVPGSALTLSTVVAADATLLASRSVSADADGNFSVSLRAQVRPNDAMGEPVPQGKQDLTLTGTSRHAIWVKQRQALALDDADGNSQGYQAYTVTRPYAVSAVSDGSSRSARIRAWGLPVGGRYYAHMLTKRGRYSGTTLRMKAAGKAAPCSFVSSSYDANRALRRWGTPLRAQVDSAKGYRAKRKGSIRSSRGAVLPAWVLAGK